MCAGKQSFLMLDFVGNSERFNEAYVPPKEPLDPVLGASYRGRGMTFVPVADAMDSWMWREWLDIGPGEEAVDLWELTPEVEKFGLAQDKGPPMCEGIETG